MFIERGLRCNVVLFAMLAAVELYVLIGVGSRRCPKLANVFRNTMASYPFLNNADIFASAADTTI